MHTYLAVFGNVALDSCGLGLSHSLCDLLALVFMDQKHILLYSLAPTVRMSQSFKVAHRV